MAVCVKCVFYEQIHKPCKPVYGLCHFTGERDPLPEEAGCHFIAGKWKETDENPGDGKG